jgi:deoxyribonuclease-4
MPLFGAHMSIAGGYHKALLAAQAHGCQTVQLFTKNSNQWAGKELTDDEVRTFRLTLRKSHLRFPLAHDSYLINMASPDEALYRRSVEAFVLEMERAERLGLRYLVTHPGAHIDSGEDAGLARVACALDEVHQRCAGYRVQVLL